MDNYIRNKYCPCMRCRLNCMMAPAILVTVGVLMLLDNLTYHASFHSTWPVILIVAGSIRVLQSSASTEGHRQPGIAPETVPPVPDSSSSEVHHG